jgi:hypothetical protein
MTGEMVAKSLDRQAVKDLAQKYGPQSLAYRFGAMHLAYQETLAALPTPKQP